MIGIGTPYLLGYFVTVYLSIGTIKALQEHGD
jgi:hypothetical protein